MLEKKQDKARNSGDIDTRSQPRLGRWFSTAHRAQVVEKEEARRGIRVREEKWV